MDLGLSPDELALQARARDFADTVVRPRAAAIDRDEQYPWDIVKALAEAGFCGMTVPKALGGQGRSFLDAVLVIEEMAKACTVTSRIAVETNMGAISTVMAYGSPAQKELAAKLVLAGDKPAICITEPDAGSDAMAMSTRADQRGDKYVINGKKHWITGAGISRLHLIFARVYDEKGEDLGVGGFLAVRDPDKGTPKGLTVTKREQTMGLRGMPEGELTFEALEVPAEMVVLPPSGFKRGFADLMNAYNSQRVGAGTVAMGIAAGALEHALRLGKGTRAVRPPDRRIPGPAMDAGRHADAAHRLAADALPGGKIARAGRQRLSRSDAGGAGQDRRRRERHQNRQRRAAVLRRARLFARACRWKEWRATCACSPSAAAPRRCCARWSPPKCWAGSCRRPATATGPKTPSPTPRNDHASCFRHDRGRPMPSPSCSSPTPISTRQPKPSTNARAPSCVRPASSRRPASISSCRTRMAISPTCCSAWRRRTIPRATCSAPARSSGLLPAGTYRFANAPHDARLAALAFALGTYQFTRYRKGSQRNVKLVVPDGVDGEDVSRIAEAVALCRDLINTPSNDMGPAEIEDAVRKLAAQHGAAINVISGEALEKGFPLIHAVGMGSKRAPQADRPHLGQGQRPQDHAGRQGRRLRHRRARHQAVERHAQHEEGHGRGGDRAGAGAHDHGGAA